MNDTYTPKSCFLKTANLNAEKLNTDKLNTSQITICNKEIEAFHDVVMTSGVTRIVITVFDGNNVTNTILPAWRFEAMNPFLSVCKTLRIIDVYIDAESHEPSLWVVMAVDNKDDLYKEWLMIDLGFIRRRKSLLERRIDDSKRIY